MGPSPDGSTILHYGDGVFYAYDVATGKSNGLMSKIPTRFWDEENDHNVVKQPHFPVGRSKDSSTVLLSDGWDIWRVPVRGGQPVNLTGNGRKDKIKYQRRFRLDPDERAGIDLSKPMYVSMFRSIRISIWPTRGRRPDSGSTTPIRSRRIFSGPRA